MSYSGKPSYSPKDSVRFLLHDITDPETFSDHEILFALSTEGNFWLAAAMLAESKPAETGALLSKTIGGLSLTYQTANAANIDVIQTKIAHWRVRGSGGWLPTLTFASTERRIFSMGQFDNPKAGGRIRTADDPADDPTT